MVWADQENGLSLHFGQICEPNSNNINTTLLHSEKVQKNKEDLTICIVWASSVCDSLLHFYTLDDIMAPLKTSWGSEAEAIKMYEIYFY